MNNQNFIVTKDKSTAAELVKRGYMQVPSSVGAFVFINTKTETFSDEIKKNIRYTDMLCI